MGKDSKIAWTDHTFNPWWGCVRVSPGCENCYAEAFSKRLGMQIWGPAKTTHRRTFTGKHWEEPMRWNEEATRTGLRKRVFCSSMADVFEDHPMVVADRLMLWALIQATPNLDWLLLTKRPENIESMIPQRWREQAQPNVWYGVTVEDEDHVDRIQYLARIPAVVRFVSYEPAIGPVQWASVFEFFKIDWLIIGGESGAKARPFNLNWARKAITECRYAGVSPFVKQLGTRPVNSAGASIKLVSYKGEDMDEWEDGLKVREWPRSAALVVA